MLESLAVIQALLSSGRNPFDRKDQVYTDGEGLRDG